MKRKSEELPGSVKISKKKNQDVSIDAEAPEKKHKKEKKLKGISSSSKSSDYKNELVDNGFMKSRNNKSNEIPNDEAEESFGKLIKGKRDEMELQNSASKPLKTKYDSKKDKLKGVKKSPLKKFIPGKGGFMKNKLGPGKSFVKSKFTPGVNGQPEKPVELDKKELRKKQKLLKQKRREKERGYAVPDEAKKMFEEMRCHKCLPERRLELSQSLYDILGGKISSAVRSHDLTRMVQWLIKVGSPEVKQKVIEEVITDTVNLSKTKYSNHIILRILKDCDKSTRKSIFNYLMGNAKNLIRIRFSSSVLDEYYTKYAKSKEKAFLRQELYSDLFKGTRSPNIKSLSDALNENPSLKSSILNNTKTTLSKLIDKKSCLQSNLVCDVLLEYLQLSEEQDKLDLLELLKNNVPLLLGTKSGAKVLMYLLWESTVKVKKSIVKELKSHVLEIAKSKGNLFLRSLFDSVDDTVLIKKAILPTILDNAEELVKDPYGKKVLLYLVAHRDTSYFHPQELEELKKADESANVKKDISIKEKELLEPSVEGLLSKIKSSPEFWFSEANIGVVALAVLKKGAGENLFETYQAVSDFFIQSMTSEDSKTIENAGIQMILKKLIKDDPIPDEDSKFAVYLANGLNVELVDKLLTSNRGCFLLVHLFESNIDSVKSKIKKLYKKGKLESKLENKEFKGAEILRNIFSQ